MRHIVFVSIILLTGSHLYAQDIPTKRELLTLFSQKPEYFGQFTWHVCNDDSAYFKNDTIDFYYRNNCFEENECCEFREWEFYNSRRLRLSQMRICQEPPIGSVGVTDNPWKMKCKRSSDQLKLELTSRDNRIERFEVVELRQCEGEYNSVGTLGYKLTLRRIN